MLTDPAIGRLTLNLGGTANVAYLPPGGAPGSVLAFDTGPGNMVIDELVRMASGGIRHFDENGHMASAGRVRPDLLDDMLRHPFFRRHPPRATGRQEFGARFATALLGHARHLGLDMPDTIASATALTARSIGEAVHQFVQPCGPLQEIVVSGGGVFNNTLMKMLAAELPRGTTLRRSDEFGLPAQAKEAIAHAVLANEAVAGNPTSLPGATGARHPVLLGSIVP
jgi:anhydro-N-acetylmuramic acid kinase